MDFLSEKLGEAILEKFGVGVLPEITVSPEGVETDCSSNAALKLAKELRRAPMEIAGELAEVLADETDFSVSVSRPGFLNFTLSDQVLDRGLELEFGQSVKNQEFSGQTVVCEFSDPNPFKVLHVGHLYTSVVGDAISRLFEYAGAKVVRANFGGDVGLHVAKTLYALLDEGFAEKIEELTIEDISKAYVAGTAAYEEDAAAKAEITRLNKEIYEINAAEKKDSGLAKLYWRGREISYDYFKKFYAGIGVKFDKFYPESSVAGLGLSKVQEELAAGVYEKSDGAVIFNGEKFGLHTRVFINQEGVPTYEAKDVGLIFQKYADYHFDRSVVITGNEQLEYMKVVLKSVEQYAPELVEKTTHLTHGLVKLPGNVKMSSRKGNFLKAVDVLEMVKDELRSEYNSTDETVSMAATKYAFLKYKMGANIIFDPKESVKMTGNSGPYLLYSAVRAKKILAKGKSADGYSVVDGDFATSENGDFANAENSDFSEAELNERERELAKKLLEYKMALSSALSEMAPYKIANYLFETAQEFSRFYEACPVNGGENKNLRRRLVERFLETMTHGLMILGIEIPEEM